ncbi:MAG: single-stranded-DNA-specific exonuclease RecJ [Candidatus Spechtbacterales bacterium]
MSLFNKIWKLQESAPAEFLNAHPNYSRTTKQLLWNRDIKKEEDIDNFFNSNYNKDVHSPHTLKDIDRAVSRISSALDKGESILIYGDYDADGVCGTALLREVFNELGAKKLSTYIPHREDEGYGLNTPSIKDFIKEGINLIVTVDCGSSNIEEIEFANSSGIDVVVIDHHQITRDDNPAFAHVNPHQEDDKYPFKDLCGTGVAFKVCTALLDFRRKKGAKAPMEGWEKWLLDLVALATVTDVMPLKGENRTLVKYGLYVLAQTRRPGLQALLEKARVNATYEDGDISTNLDGFTLGFILGPRINAAGRMEHANLALDLLNAKTKKEADVLAHILDTKNKERQKLVEDIINEIDHKQLESSNVIFAGTHDWPIGVAGIVAGRLTQAYNKPAFIYQKKGNKLIGSVRGPEHLNIVEILQGCEDFLDKFGGHRQAAGFTALVEHEDNLLRSLKTQVALAMGEMSKEEVSPRVVVDSEISAEEINWNLYDELEKFDPYGESNPKPVFLLRGVIIRKPSMVGDAKNHFKCLIETSSGRTLKAIGFRFPPEVAHTGDGSPADILFELDKNEWNGTRELDLKLVDVSAKYLL